MRRASAQTHSRWEGVLVLGEGQGQGAWERVWGGVSWCRSQLVQSTHTHAFPLNTTTTGPPLPPQDFRKHLIGLTDVTHTSFDKLVAQLERGFEDMDT